MGGQLEITHHTDWYWASVGGQLYWKKQRKVRYPWWCEDRSGYKTCSGWLVLFFILGVRSFTRHFSLIEYSWQRVPVRGFGADWDLVTQLHRVITAQISGSGDKILQSYRLTGFSRARITVNEEILERPWQWPRLRNDRIVSSRSVTQLPTSSRPDMSSFLQNRPPLVATSIGAIIIKRWLVALEVSLLVLAG